MFYWVLKTVVLGPLLKLLFRPWVEGEEHIPDEGAAIFASNHLSFSDSIFLPLMVPRRMTFLAKSDYFTGRGIKGKATAAFFKGVGQVPVDRSGGKAGEAALNSGLRILRRGELLGIYPEGTRSPDGRLYRGRTGVARMALEAGVPVLPVAMIGTDKAQPTGKKLPRIMRIGIRIGRPLSFARYEGMEDDRFVLRSITDEIMYELMLLSGQEYVDEYATSMKDRIVRAAKVRARELQEAARPGSAAKELEEALDAAEGTLEQSDSPVDDVSIGDGRKRPRTRWPPTPVSGPPADHVVRDCRAEGPAPPARRTTPWSSPPSGAPSGCCARSPSCMRCGAPGPGATTCSSRARRSRSSASSRSGPPSRSSGSAGSCGGTSSSSAWPSARSSRRGGSTRRTPPSAGRRRCPGCGRRSPSRRSASSRAGGAGSAPAG